MRIAPLTLQDQPEFLKAVGRSRLLHRPWVNAPSTAHHYRKWIGRKSDGRQCSFAVWLRIDGQLVGVINLSEIVRGSFQSAYLGYYAFSSHQRQGLMSEGLSLVIQRAFSSLKLHRLEANIQPGNLASLRLVKRLGFRLEGYSPRYLRIGGRWRDHERWAITREEWRAAHRQSREKGVVRKIQRKSS